MGIYLRAFHHIGTELNLMTEYVYTMRAALREAHEANTARVRAQAKGLPEEEANEVYNDSYEDDMCLGDLFPALSGTWTFISIMSFLEHQMVYICRQVEAAKDNNEIFKPRAGVLDACKDFLKKRGVAVPAGGKEWGEIKHFQLLRNAIVHRLGELEEFVQGVKGEDDGIHAYVKRRTDVSITDNKLILTHEFCLVAIEVVRTFLKQVVDLIPRNLYAVLRVERER